MALFVQPTLEQRQLWAAWIAELPDCLQTVARHFNPWTLYRLITTEQRVTVAAFHEPKYPGGKVSLTVNVTGEFNLLTHDRAVFGIDPNHLVECDLPAPNELLGTMMTSKEVEENIHALRVLVRPDLWEMNDYGIAVLRTDMEEEREKYRQRTGFNPDGTPVYSRKT